LVFGERHYYFGPQSTIEFNCTDGGAGWLQKINVEVMNLIGCFMNLGIVDCVKSGSRLVIDLVRFNDCVAHLAGALGDG
jgi:hypothetical protein